MPRRGPFLNDIKHRYFGQRATWAPAYQGGVLVTVILDKISPSQKGEGARPRA